MELNQRTAELDDMMGTFNEVQEGFRKINAAESRVDLQRGTITENSASAKQQIASDIEFISKQMEENKAQIAKLQAQLNNSNYNSAQMKKAVAALTAELNAKQQRIEELQTELASKNIRIQELDAAVSDLSVAKETLAAENEAKDVYKRQVLLMFIILIPNSSKLTPKVCFTIIGISISSASPSTNITLLANNKLLLIASRNLCVFKMCIRDRI